MSAGDAVREQFSALQKQQKDRLNQLQEKSNKKRNSTADVSLGELYRFKVFFSIFRPVLQ
jgi:hypothetical protein